MLSALLFRTRGWVRGSRSQRLGLGSAEDQSPRTSPDPSSPTIPIGRRAPAWHRQRSGVMLQEFPVTKFWSLTTSYDYDFLCDLGPRESTDHRMLSLSVSARHLNRAWGWGLWQKQPKPGAKVSGTAWLAGHLKYHSNPSWDNLESAKKSGLILLMLRSWNWYHGSHPCRTIRGSMDWGLRSLRKIRAGNHRVGF